MPHLKNVLPGFPVNDFVDCGFNNAVFFRQLRVAESVRECSFSAYLPDKIVVQNSVRVLYADRPYLVGAGTSMLLNTVSNVFLVRSYPNVSRVAAGWIVAAMAGAQSLCNRAIGQLVGDSVRPVASTRADSPPATSVSVSVGGLLPQPTGIRGADFNTRPESGDLFIAEEIDGGKRSGYLMGSIFHGNDMLSVRAVSQLIAARRFAHPSTFPADRQSFAA